MAGTFNRRLCVYRLLVLFFLQRFSFIRARMVDKNAPRVDFEQKFTTKCAGVWVEVGRDQYVGRSMDEFDWPDASTRLQELCERPPSGPESAVPCEE